MEVSEYSIVFEKMSEATEQINTSEIVKESDEIAELRKIVLEVTQPEYNFVTIT